MSTLTIKKNNDRTMDAAQGCTTCLAHTKPSPAVQKDKAARKDDSHLYPRYLGSGEKSDFDSRPT